MKNPPAFQFYVQDFLTGTMHMTAEQVGGYIRLLCHQWDKDGLPDDDKILLKISGVRKNNLPMLRNKFVKNDEGKLHNLRLHLVKSEQIEYTKKQVENGKKGGLARSGAKVSLQAPLEPKVNPSPSPSTSPSNNDNIPLLPLRGERDFFEEVEKWAQSVIDGNDQFFTQMVENKIKGGVDVKVKQLWVEQHTSKISRQGFQNKTISGFRNSLLSYLISCTNGSQKDEPTPVAYKPKPFAER